MEVQQRQGQETASKLKLNLNLTALTLDSDGRAPTKLEKERTQATNFNLLPSTRPREKSGGYGV
jgi:hypothetical protein